MYPVLTPSPLFHRMKLTLVPPPSFPIPPSLHSHFVDPPTEAKLRTSPSTSQARDIQLLRRLGVQIDSPLALDKAAWLPSTAVEEVVWDFEQEEVVVLMWDGTSTRWGFDERGMLGLSEEFISDGDEDEIMSSQDPNSAPRGATRASEIYDRLYSLCVELRSAYEDVGTPSPGLFVAGEPGVPLCADSTFDFSELLELSSDPALKFPFEWSAASSQVEWFLDDPDVPPPSRRTSARLASHNSASGDDPDDQVESLLLESRSRTGQLPSRCRPTSFDLLVPDPSQRGSHDFLSFVSLLSQTRHTLLDIFSLVIVPALQSRLHPTFATWVAASAEKECLRLAVRKAAELAQLFEGLLADDGNTFDPNDGEDEESEMFSSQEDLRTGYHAEDHESQSSSSDTDIDAEFEEDLGHKLWSSLQESTATRKSKKLKRNVMAAMRDDYALVEWCERRRDRAREDAREDSREGSPRTNVLTTQVIPRWEASRPYPVDGKDIPSSPTLKSGWDASDDLSDDDDDGSIGEGRSIFFHPTDSTGLDLLPYRLPKGLLRTAQGFEMERSMCAVFSSPACSLTLNYSSSKCARRRILFSTRSLGSRSASWSSEPLWRCTWTSGKTVWRSISVSISFRFCFHPSLKRALRHARLPASDRERWPEIAQVTPPERAQGNDRGGRK